MEANKQVSNNISKYHVQLTANTLYHQLQVVQTVLPYHHMMTPKWIHNNAVITKPHAFYPQYLEILPTTGVLDQQALQVQLVPPNILRSTDSVTVTLTVAVDISFASSNLGMSLFCFFLTYFSF